MARAPLPSLEELRAYILESPTPVTKREIVRAFNVRGDDRIELKRMIRKLLESGAVEKNSGKSLSAPESLPSVLVVEINDIDLDGEVYAIPVNEGQREMIGDERILIQPDKGKRSAPAISDRVLVKIKKDPQGGYDGSIIRRLDGAAGRVLGLVVHTAKGILLRPTSKKEKHEFDIPHSATNGASEGDLVLAEIMPSKRMGKKQVRVVEIIGAQSDPRSISLIAAHTYNLRTQFPEEAVTEAEKAKVPPLGAREDLRTTPLVTIDGADARDFDDAVFAEPDDDPKNKGGWHIIVAIADVSHYVTHKSALDQEAYARGNSTYFPDRVLPMLPEALSNGLCSLVPHEDRACMAMHMWIDQNGKLLRHKVVRALMRSAERLIYEQVQAAYDGVTDDKTEILLEPVIKPLYAVYDILRKAREKRGALDLDLPERQIVINDDNIMTGVRMRDRLDSHMLIEEFMILANVAAAQALEAKQAPCMYRIHDKPAPEKVTSLAEFVEEFGYTFSKGQVVQPSHFNKLLKQCKGSDEAHVINTIVLRSQSQAVYSPDNHGHFGLALTKYAHFTSPIRRYADLIVHRSLARAYGLGDGGLSDEESVRMGEIGEHISTTERQSMQAERDAVDRFAAAYLSQQVGAEFQGHISGVSRFGLFVSLDDNGADGLVPMRSLPDDFYIHDEHQHSLIGRKYGRVYQMCAPVTVQLAEADPLTGGLILELMNPDAGATIPGFNVKRPMPQKKSKQGYKQRGKKGARRGSRKKKR